MRWGFLCAVLAVFLATAVQATQADALSIRGYGGGEGYFQPVIYGVTPISGDWYYASTGPELRAALNASSSGDVVYIADDAEINLASSVGYSSIVDMSTGVGRVIHEGVTLASGRGQNGSSGALLYLDEEDVVNDISYVFYAGGSDVRITGLQLQGPHAGTTEYDYESNGRTPVPPSMTMNPTASMACVPISRCTTVKYTTSPMQG